MAIINSIVANVGGTAAANIYASAGNTAVTTIYLCNALNSVVTVNLFCVAGGANVANPSRNMLYSNLQIAPNDTYVIDSERLLLGQGDHLRANASIANSVLATISFTSI